MKTDTIGINIKKYRLEKNLSQSELARKLDLSTRQLGEIEAGNSLSTIENLNLIAQTLDIPIDLLLKDCDKSFLIYSIDDYLNNMDRNQARDILKTTLDFMEDSK